MIQERRSPAISSAGPANTLVSAHGSASIPWWGTWRDRLNWESPADVYLAGYWDGREAEREREQLEADTVHRAAVRQIRGIIERATAREKPVQPTGYLGGPVPDWDSLSPEYLAELKDRADKARAAAGDRPVWTTWAEVRRDVSPAVWAAVWSALSDGTRRNLSRGEARR